MWTLEVIISSSVWASSLGFCRLLCFLPNDIVGRLPCNWNYLLWRIDVLNDHVISQWVIMERLRDFIYWHKVEINRQSYDKFQYHFTSLSCRIKVVASCPLLHKFNQFQTYFMDSTTQGEGLYVCIYVLCKMESEERITQLFLQRCYI